ncbi:hypothetical protein [Halomonas salifodinae]|uniref:hypothetical protein n=1 Tax=Halomonas salifodinae TaxID=438745 RepID=UPI0033A3472E
MIYAVFVPAFLVGFRYMIRSFYGHVAMIFVDIPRRWTRTAKIMEEVGTKKQAWLPPVWFLL